MSDVLEVIKNRYNNPSVYVTESGVSDANGTNDNLRINYFYSYIEKMLKAIKEKNCNVKGYFIWSFLDSYEWRVGYT